MDLAKISYWVTDKFLLLLMLVIVTGIIWIGWGVLSVTWNVITMVWNTVIS